MCVALVRRADVLGFNASGLGLMCWVMREGLCVGANVFGLVCLQASDDSYAVLKVQNRLVGLPCPLVSSQTLTPKTPKPKPHHPPAVIGGGFFPQVLFSDHFSPHFFSGC